MSEASNGVGKGLKLTFAIAGGVEVVDIHDGVAACAPASGRRSSYLPDSSSITSMSGLPPEKWPSLRYSF